MARLSKLKVGILNVKLHPHTQERYLAFFEDLSQLEQSTKIWGTRHGVFGKPKRIEEKGQVVGIRGYFYHFTEIDPEQPIFDIKEFRQIEVEEGQPFPFSTRYKLHSREVMWFFWVKSHYIFFDLGAIGHQWAQKFLIAAANTKNMVDKYGIPDVEIVSSVDTIEKILRIPKLTSIMVTLSRPNADDPNEIMKRIKDRMEAQNARTYVQELRTRAKDYSFALCASID